MKEEALDFIKENVKKVKDKVDLSIVKNSLIKLYFASPPKIQFLLARYGVKAIVNKNKEELEEIIRH